MAITALQVNKISIKKIFGFVWLPFAALYQAIALLAITVLQIYLIYPEILVATPIDFSVKICKETYFWPGIEFGRHYREICGKVKGRGSLCAQLFD